MLRDHTANETALNELQKKWDRVAALKIELQKSQQDLNRIEGEEKLLLERRERFQKQINDIRQLDADYARLQGELAEISGKLSILENETGAKCPLCERELGAEHIGLIRDKYSLEMKDKSVLAKTLRHGFRRRRERSGGWISPLNRRRSSSIRLRPAPRLK